MRDFFYKLSGTRLESTIALATLPRSDGRERDAIRFRCLPPRAQGDLTTWRTLYEIPRAPPSEEPFAIVARDDDRVLVRFVGAADFVLELAGDTLQCTPVSGCPDGVLEQLLVDQLLPRIFYLRGRPTLHASAVQLPGAGVVAFVGPAGSGKSTLCAALTQRGARGICDDSLMLAIDGPDVQVLPGYPSLRIWPDSAHALFEATSLPHASPWTEKRRVEQPAVALSPNLAALVLLEPTGTTPPELQVLSRREAFDALTPFVHRLDLGERGALDAEFALLTELVSRAAVARLRFAQDYVELPLVVRRVLELAASTASAA